MSRDSCVEIVFTRREDQRTLKAARFNGTSVHREQMINYLGG